MTFGCHISEGIMEGKKGAEIMEYIPAKTIINHTKNDRWFGADYNMNIYKGCCHGCIYCDSRSDCYRIEDFDRVRVKKDALRILRDDLRRKQKRGVIATGAMSDPYNPFERQMNLTRHSLELINAFHFGVAIDTKSPLVTRDIDILKDIQKHSSVIVKLTITTADDQLCKKIERNVAVSSQRFKALKELSNNGIYCGVLLMPILPFINDTEENIAEILRLAKYNGAKFIFPAFGMTLRDNQRAHYYQQLEYHFPTLKEKYLNRYGNRYSCNSPKSRELYAFFAEECKKVGLLYKMGDIIAAYKQNNYGQLSLF